MNRQTAALALTASSALSLAASLALAHTGADVSAADLGPVDGSLLSTPATVRMMVFGNHLPLEILGGNLLTTNRDSLEALIESPLATASFRQGTLHEALLDPYAREVMQALVECALASDQSVSWSPTPEERSALADAAGASGIFAGGSSWTSLEYGVRAPRKDVIMWHGSAGLCPDWHTDKPSEACQELVSACLLARNNAFGATVDISMIWQALAPEGSDVAAPSPEALEEAARFPVREGAFFGNLLDPEQLNERAEVRLDKEKGYEIARPALDKVEFVYEAAFFCHPSDHSAVFFDFVRYASERACVNPYGETAEGCLARHVGACGDYPSGDEARMGPADVCQQEISDPLTGRKFYGDCGFGVWKNPITVFLEEDCRINPAVCALGDEDLAPTLGDWAPPVLSFEDRCDLFPAACSIVSGSFQEERYPVSRPLTEAATPAVRVSR
ncbi:hypothetical protein [Sorangium cellulosum]|uniref:Secreted protein n=1 Tax=Sorangium cellulosum TaxID=56 RepID=A0A150QIC6_SORCE|nr:hypothetical protein [Sorangium cellulosum]KYF67693.1 hypothetical protein BE15_31295 [Sorangium cellulosum]